MSPKILFFGVGIIIVSILTLGYLSFQDNSNTTFDDNTPSKAAVAASSTMPQLNLPTAYFSGETLQGKSGGVDDFTQKTQASARNDLADIIWYDTDGDGEEENILIYNCYTCNAPPRELAIIDDGRLTFFVEGGNLQFTPLESGSFIISESNVPRDGRLIKTTYRFNNASNNYEVAENVTER